MSQGVVLIADPDADARSRYEVALARAGFSVVSTPDGGSALRLATRLAPDDLVTEIDLPQLDGFTLARRLRHQPDTRHIGIVAVTGYAGNDLHARAAESGIDTVLRKNRPLYELVRVVRSTVRNSRMLVKQSERLRQATDEQIFEGANLRERAEDVIAESRVLAADIAHALGEPFENAAIDAPMLDEADGARDVTVVDRHRGEELFQVLFARYGDHPLLHYKRGEAYRAMGRRKLAHQEFVVAAAGFPPGVWRDRARFAAMRTRSHHEKPR